MSSEVVWIEGERNEAMIQLFNTRTRHLLTIEGNMNVEGNAEAMQAAADGALRALNGEPDPRVAELEEWHDKYKAILSDCLKALRTTGAYDSIPDHITRLMRWTNDDDARVAKFKMKCVELEDTLAAREQDGGGG